MSLKARSSINTAPALDPATLRTLLPLFRQINDLKRIAFHGDTTIATHRFEQAWKELVVENDVSKVASMEAAFAVTSCIMGPITAEHLIDGGMEDADVRSVFKAALNDPQLGLDAVLIKGLSEALPQHFTESNSIALPDWISRLRHIERAGATCPGKRRIVLQPQENHAEHCWVVAACAALIAIAHNDDPAGAFLLGMSHHMPNAWLPDGGFAGEIAIGTHLPGIIERFETRALATLPPPLATDIRALLNKREDISEMSVAYFNAADAIDRVLQMAWFEEAARFELSHATGDMEIVHAGALKAFQDNILRDLGLL